MKLSSLRDLPNWKILVIDDDDEVHLITREALKNIVFDAKPVSFLFAKSASEAIELIDRESGFDIALILLDLVMEDDEAGLRVIKHIRNTLKNQFTRIVLRTGMADYALARALIVDYDINDFREKTDLTPNKLFALAYSSIRNFANLRKTHEAEKQTQDQQKQLLQADKMIALGTLVSGVAHEINNPNNLIIFNTPVLERIWQDIEPFLSEKYDKDGYFELGGLDFSELKDKIPTLLHGIKQGANRIENIIADLREFSLDRSVGMNEMVNINDVADDAVKLIQPKIKHSTNAFCVKRATNLPLVKGNFQKLEQVVINLLLNACQSLAKETAKITISTEYLPQEGLVRLSVKDEGVGIAKENLTRVVDPFFTTKRDQKGTGLGLSISDSITREHGGFLEFSSEEAVGTVASLILPRYITEENEE